MVQEKKSRYQGTYTSQMILGIFLCIIAVSPIFISMIIFGEDDFHTALSVPFLLLFCGCWCISDCQNEYYLGCLEYAFRARGL